MTPRMGLGGVSSSYWTSQKLFLPLTFLPFCKANHLSEGQTQPLPPQCSSSHNKRNTLPPELMGLLSPQGLLPFWALVGRDNARHNLTVTDSPAPVDVFLGLKGWCPKEEPLQVVPTSHSSVNAEWSPCALTPSHPRATPFSFGNGECPQREGPHGGQA